MNEFLRLLVDMLFMSLFWPRPAPSNEFPKAPGVLVTLEALFGVPYVLYVKPNPPRF